MADHHPWTRDEDFMLEALVAQRKWTDTDIAIMLGRSKRSIQRHRRRLGLESSYWGPTQDEQLRFLVGERRSDPEIVKAMGWSLTSIRGRRRALGLKACGKSTHLGHKPTPEARAKIGEMARRRWSDPAYRAAHLPTVLAGLKRGREVYQETRFRPPPINTEEGRLYIKLYRALGASAAKEAMNLEGAS